jgi:pimeloyl-ACP methyl ester carboxylesterase
MTFPAATVTAIRGRAETVRSNGMLDVAEIVAKSATSRKTQVENPIATAYIKTLLRRSDAEGYAKGCTAIAGFSSHPEDAKWGGLQVGGKVVVVAGDEDNSAPLPGVRSVCERIGGKLVVLKGVGHWHVLEDLEGVKEVLEDVLC